MLIHSKDNQISEESMRALAITAAELDSFRLTFLDLKILDEINKLEKTNFVVEYG